MQEWLANAVGLLRVCLFTFMITCCLLFTGQPAQAANSDLYLLAIGVNDYPQLKQEAQLAFADDDARSMEVWAKSQEGRLYGRVWTKLLIGRAATRANIVTELATFFLSAGREDQLIVYMSGHGDVEKFSKQYYFLPSDAQAESLVGTGLSQSELMGHLSRSNRAHNRVLVLLDTCYAGALIDDEGSAGTGALLAALDRIELQDKEVPEGARVWSIISAGTSRERAPEGKEFSLPSDPPGVEGHGAFTSAALEALTTPLADVNHNGIISLQEFTSYISARAHEKSHGVLNPTVVGKAIDIALSWLSGTEEICDGTDNNLDGKIDEGFPDNNHNRIPDCLDLEVCNGSDDDGDGQIDEGYDRDGDGHKSRALCGQWGDDCDDSDLSMHPDQKDWNNLRDDDCDGLTDEDGISLKWNQKIPDLVEARHRRLQQAGLGYLVLGAGMAVLGAYSYQQVQTIETQTRESGTVSPEQVRSYRQWSAISAGFGGIGALTIGYSIKFTWSAREFRLETYPPSPDRAIARSP